MNSLLKWALFSRSRILQNLAVRCINPKQSTFQPSKGSISILTCGDMSFDPKYRIPPGVYRSTSAPLNRMHLIHKIWRRICRYLMSPVFLFLQIDYPYVELQYKDATKDNPGRNRAAYNTRIDIDIDDLTPDLKFDYPFQKIRPFLQKKDVVWANLETPLSHSTRSYGFFISDPGYAKSIKDAGITMVCLANNHIFDAGEVGFEDTIKHLEQMRIPYTGAGQNMESARSGYLTTLRDIRLGFLSYTQYCNANYASVAAKHSGILPLDPNLIIEDICAIRQQADLVFVSLHWGIINQHSVHRKQVALAHQLIDAGADAIIGHSPHIPHGVEVYKGKPVLYSLGNFIFPYGRNQWTDNILAEIVINKQGIEGIKIYPISGQGAALFQPYLLQGTNADALLHELQVKSAVFNTGIKVNSHIGYIPIDKPA